jgi:rod shape-determining protein MreC
VVEVSALTSRVMLVTDAAFAVPVQVMRNDFRSIAAGTGELATLELEYVPVTADIKQGDVLVTSGLGGTFPRGYPVAEVISVDVDPTMTYARVRARPLAALDRSRHVLVVFGVSPIPEEKVPEETVTEEQVTEKDAPQEAPSAVDGASQARAEPTT